MGTCARISIGIQMGTERARAVRPGSSKGEFRPSVDIFLVPVNAVGAEHRIGLPKITVHSWRSVPGVALVKVRVHLEKARKHKRAPKVRLARSRRGGKPRCGVAHRNNGAFCDQDVAFAPRFDSRVGRAGGKIQRSWQAGQRDSRSTEKVHGYFSGELTVRGRAHDQKMKSMQRSGSIIRGEADFHFLGRFNAVPAFSTIHAEEGQ